MRVNLVMTDLKLNMSKFIQNLPTKVITLTKFYKYKYLSDFATADKSPYPSTLNCSDTYFKNVHDSISQNHFRLCKNSTIELLVKLS